MSSRSLLRLDLDSDIVVDDGNDDDNEAVHSALDVWIKFRSICIEYRYVYEVAVHAWMTSGIKLWNVVAVRTSDGPDMAC